LVPRLWRVVGDLCLTWTHRPVKSSSAFKMHSLRYSCQLTRQVVK